MPLDFQAYSAQIRKVSVPAAGMGEFDVWYRPSTVTPVAIEELVAAAKEDDEAAFASIIEQVVRFVSKWDIVDPDGSQMPVTKDFARRLGVQLLTGIVNAIRDDINPKPQILAPSGSFS